MKFVVTTRVERLRELKEQGFYLIGIDGTVPKGGSDLYDELYDHHHPGGALCQIEDMYGYDFYVPNLDWSRVCYVTTMIDADAICASIYRYMSSMQIPYMWREDEEQILRAISYDCDHLLCPAHLESESFTAKDASMVVAALKEESNKLVNQFNLNPNRREWSVEDKEVFASAAFEQGFNLVAKFLSKGTWDYKSIAAPYWDKVETHVAMIIKEQRVEEYNNCLIFNASGLGGEYIDPRAWLLASKKMNFVPSEAVTLTCRDVYSNNEYIGMSYTLGSVPLHPKQKKLDYTVRVYKELTHAESIIQAKLDEEPEGYIDPKNPWGGRSGVGGSGWNEVSNLNPHQVIDIVLANL